VTNCSFEEVQILVTQGALDALLLNLNDENAKLVEKTLIALNKIFHHGQVSTKSLGGANIFVTMVLEANAGHFLEKLQKHPDMTVYNLTSYILDSYFPMEDV